MCCKRCRRHVWRILYSRMQSAYAAVTSSHSANGECVQAAAHVNAPTSYSCMLSGAAADILFYCFYLAQNLLRTPNPTQAVDKSQALSAHNLWLPETWLQICSLWPSRSNENWACKVEMEPVAELLSVTCYMGSHGTYHPTQVNASALIPAKQASTRFARFITYLGGIGDWVGQLITQTRP